MESSAPQNASTKQPLPKIDRPELKQDISHEDWATFESEWKRFKRCTKIDDHEVAHQLFPYTERTLKHLLLKENSIIITQYMWPFLHKIPPSNLLLKITVQDYHNTIYVA